MRLRFSIFRLFIWNKYVNKKKFIFLKNKKIDSKSRQFNKELGACILDLGCYTTSLTILISSLIKSINNKNFKIRFGKRGR